jgi:cytoskeleton protein RodZ
LTELTGIGAELRRARESQGLTLADVAQQLKFATHQIEFLENERFDRLPGPTIARGMVRNYARLLNLDGEALVERMSPKVAAAPDVALQGPALKQPVPFSQGGGRATWLYAGLSLVVLALAGVVAYEWQRESAAPQFVVPGAPPPAPAAAPAQAEPEPQPVERMAEPAAPPPPPVTAAEPPKPEPKKPEPRKAIEQPVPPEVAVAPPVEQPVEQAAPREATGNLRRIVLICEEDSWLQVRDGTGQSVVQSLYPAGSERVVRGRGPFEILIGNARGVRLLVDDKPVDLRRHTRGDVARLTIQ